MTKTRTTISRRDVLALIGTAAVALPISRSSWAIASGDIGTFIDQLGVRAIEALTGTDITQEIREQRFRTLFEEFFDLPGIGKFVLARYWRVATPEEQAEFLDLFVALIVRTYAQRFTEFSGEKFKLQDIVPESAAGYHTAHSIVERPSDEYIRVDWLVREHNGVLKIEDVKVEGLSMAQTYRSEFASVIQGGGGKVAALLDALRNKTGELGEQNAAQ
jgi:phospholipid transport system substrate-binding protein